VESDRLDEPGDKPSPAGKPLAEPGEFVGGTPSFPETAELDRVLTRATQLFPDALRAPGAPGDDDKRDAEPLQANELDTNEPVNDEKEVESGAHGDGKPKSWDPERSGPEDTESEETEQRPSRKRSGINVLSVVALAMAIALSPLAVVFGYLALGQTRRASQRGETIALWAIGLGWLALAAWVVAMGALVAIGVERGVAWEDFLGFLASFGIS
jgi:hypothetical protein